MTCDSEAEDSYCSVLAEGAAARLRHVSARRIAISARRRNGSPLPLVVLLLVLTDRLGRQLTVCSHAVAASELSAFLVALVLTMSLLGPAPAVCGFGRSRDRPVGLP